MRRFAVLLALAGCGKGSEAEDTDGSGDTEPGGLDTAVDPDRPDDVCGRWNYDRAYWDVPEWEGDKTACDAGALSTDSLAVTRRGVNLYRFLVGLPAVGVDAAWSRKAQECALMMDVNNQLSHTPPSSWQCYTSEGAEAAGSSNIALLQGVFAIDAYIGDWGNETTLGHRRWIFSNSLDRVGIGSTDRASCLWVIGGSANTGREWVAFPPAGDVPHEAASLADTTGWSIQSDTLVWVTPRVTLTKGAETLPVTVRALDAGYGSASAISWTPSGWRVERDVTYHVKIEGSGTPIEYDVNVLSCRD